MVFDQCANLHLVIVWTLQRGPWSHCLLYCIYMNLTSGLRLTQVVVPHSLFALQLWLTDRHVMLKLAV